MAVKKKKSGKLTIRDVAEEVGVSVTTVSYVLNNKGSVSEEVRKKVQKAAKKLGYTGNRAARAMKMGRFHIIGLIIPNIENPFFPSLAQAILQACQLRGYQVFMVDTEGSLDNQVEAIRGLLSQGVDGIIIFPVNDQETLPKNLGDIPLVVLDRDWQSFDRVQAEYTNGGELIAKHLMALGHKRFGLLDGPQDVLSSRDRTEGFIAALQGGCEVVWRIEHAFRMELAEQAQQALRDQSVTAIVCGNDLIAIAALSYLQSQGIRVPKDVSVVGFDDINLARLMSPALSTVKMPTHAMGAEAVNLLLRRLDQADAPVSTTRVLLGVEPSFRASSGEASGGA